MTNLTVTNIDQHVKFIKAREGDTLPKVYVLEILEQIKGYSEKQGEEVRLLHVGMKTQRVYALNEIKEKDKRIQEFRQWVLSWNVSIQVNTILSKMSETFK